MSVYYMGSADEMTQEIWAEVERFIQLGVPGCTEESQVVPTCHAVTLGTKQKDGIRLTVLSLLKEPCLSELFMMSNRQSQKVKNLMECSQAEVSITNGLGYVVLGCRAELLTDEQTKTDKWEDWFIQYHSQGAASPDYVVIRLVPQIVRALFYDRPER